MNPIENHVEAAKRIQSDLVEANDTGQFMAVIWRVDESGELRMKRTTWRFPKAQFENAMNLLSVNIDEELGSADRSPLPAAEFVERMVEEAMGDRERFLNEAASLGVKLDEGNE